MHLDQVLRHYDHCQASVAKAANVGQSTVSMWKARGHIPELAQLRLEKASGGRLKAETPSTRQTSRR